MNFREYIHPRRKLSVKKLHNFQCYICKLQKSPEELEIDHRIPISNGGTNEISNLFPICIDCHIKKNSNEWKEGTYFNKSQESILKLTPEQKLSQVLTFLNEKKSFTYPEIAFMVENHPILSTFTYNSTLLIRLFNQIRGIDYKKKHEETKYKQFIAQRDLLMYILSKNSNLTCRELESLLKSYGFDMHYTQIADICKKIEDNKTKTDKSEHK